MTGVIAACTNPVQIALQCTDARTLGHASRRAWHPLWRQMYDPDSGALNLLLTSIGLLGQPVNWLNSFELAIPAEIIAGIWGEIPKVALFLLAGLKSIPQDLYEAFRRNPQRRMPKSPCRPAPGTQKMTRCK